MSKGARFRSRGVEVSLPVPLLGRMIYTSPVGKVVDGSDIFGSTTKSPEEKKTWDYTHPGPPYRGAGTFLSVRYERPTLPVTGGVYRGSNQILGSTNSPFVGGTVPWSYRYEGDFSFSVDKGYGDDFFASGHSTSPDSYSSIHPDDMSSAGSRAYSSMRPKPEMMNLLTAAYELKDLPDMLKTTAKGMHDAYKISLAAVGGSPAKSGLTSVKMPAEVAGHFLNHQFGWRPFVQDLSNLFGVVDSIGAHIAKKKRENNVWIHRTRSDPDSQTEQILSDTSGSSNLSVTPALGSSGTNNFILPSSARYTVSLEKSTKMWYAGWFKQYRLEFDADYERLHPDFVQQRQVLTSLGYYISPIHVYKVTPWTWMIDWFTNVGDQVKAYSDLLDDSIVCKHLCAMRHITSKIRYRQRAVLRTGGSLDFSFYRGFETKYRAVGLSPYGFSLLPNALSGTQLAILAAIGLSH